MDTNVVEWLLKNKEWLFSGVGVTALLGLVAFARLLPKLRNSSPSAESLVIGRTLGPVNTDGRQHNPNHQVSLAIGKPFRGGIVGSVAPVGTDYGATAIDSASGAGRAGGDIAPTDTLASFGKTVLAAIGADAATIDKSITFGKVVKGALV